MILRTLLILVVCLFTSQADSRGLAQGGGGGGGGTSTTLVTAVTISPSPAVGGSSNLAGTVWATLGTLTSDGMTAVAAPVYSITGSSPAGFNGVISGGSVVAGSSTTAANTYTLSIQVAGSNLANTGGTFTQTGLSFVITSAPVTISGVSCPPATAATGLQGTVVGTCAATYAGGTLSGEVITINNSLSNKFQVSSNTLQFGSAPPGAGSYSPTVTVTNPAAANSPQTFTVPVTVTAAAITMTTPVTCAPTLAGCAGIVGNTTGTVIGTLAATPSGGTPGTLSCIPDATTSSAMAGGRFQIDSGCVLKTGSVAYTAGTYNLTPSFACQFCSGVGNFRLPFTATVNPSGGVTLVQTKVLFNNDNTSHPSGFWLDAGQPFAKGQIPAGRNVLWKTGGGTTVPSQMDDAVFWPDGSLKFAAFTLQYPGTIASGASDVLGAYNVSGSPSHTCTATNPNTVQQKLLSHNFKITVGIAGTVYSMLANNEQNTRPTTNVRVIRSGPLDCAVYVFGELRNGTGAASTPQGQAWAVMYIDFRSDGTFRAWGQPLNCRPLTLAGAITPFCNRLTTSADANGNTYALYDGATTLMGCDDLGCIPSGNANGAVGLFYGGASLFTVDADGYPYDSSQDARMVVLNPPLPHANDPTTRGVYDAKMYPWFGWTNQEITDIDFGNAPGPKGNQRDTGAQATIAATISGGVVTGLSIVTAGYGYQPNWTQALSFFDVTTNKVGNSKGTYTTDANGHVVSVALTTPGSGYVVPPAVTISSFSVRPGFCALDASNCGYGTTGDNPYIGMATNYAVSAWFTGAAGTSNAYISSDFDRKYALVSGSLTITMRDAANGLQLNAGFCSVAPGGPCAGMRQNVLVGYVPGSPNIPLQGHGQNTTNHSPNWAFWQCLNTGYRPFCDIVRDTADMDLGVLSATRRCTSVNNTNMNGNTYCGVVAFDPQTRQMAWNLRDLTAAAWITPDFLVDGVTQNPEKAYFVDIVDGPNGTLAYFNDWFVAPHYGTTGTNPQSTLGWIENGVSGGGFGNLNAAADNPGGIGNTAPWQDNYLATQIALDLSRGWTNLTATGPFFTQYMQKQWLGRAINGCQATGTIAFGSSAQVAPHHYSRSGLFGIYAQSWTDLYWGDLSSYVFPKYSMYVDTQTSAPPITTMHVQVQNVNDAGNFAIGSALVSQGAFNTSQPQTGGPAWTVPEEGEVTSVTPDSSSPSNLGFTITLNHGLTGTVPIPTGTFHGYIDNGTPGVAGTVLHITSIDSGSLLGGMSILGPGVAAGTNFKPDQVPTSTGTYTIDLTQLVGTSGSTVAMRGSVPWNIINWNGSRANSNFRTNGLVPFVPSGGCNVLASPTNTIAGTAFPNGGYIDASGILYLNKSSDYFAMYYYAASQMLAAQGVPNAALMQNWFENTVIPTVDSVAGKGIPTPAPWAWWSDADYSTNPQMRMKPPAFNP